MLIRIITGGQTGADQAAWRTAGTFGIATGGSMPCGFLTEDGPRPQFAQRFGAVPMTTESYPLRTEQNVRDSDATIWFGEMTTSGADATMKSCQTYVKPCLSVDPIGSFQPSHVAGWLKNHDVRILNVAGNRESDQPGIGEQVERFLGQVLELLGHRRG
ncbi:MAG TPA: putative molybdenum carrier protein [Pirellulales bacterium]|nr:putative molybdenum carrier protein [Pirellulales bacterium]